MQSDSTTPPTTLRCRTCHETKPLPEFRRNKAKRFGYDALCVLCNRAYAAEARKRKPYTGRGGNTLRTCETCGREFLAWTSDVEEGRARFCQRTCKRQPKPKVIYPYDLTDGGYARIPLRNQDGSVRAYALVDAADAEWLSQWRWSFARDKHVYRTLRLEGGRQARVAIHRAILGLCPGDGLEGDHINHDPLDNRRANLRAVPQGTNAQNLPSYGGTSRFRGVHRASGRQPWVAQVYTRGAKRYYERFDSEEEAAEAARRARQRLMPYAVD